MSHLIGLEIFLNEVFKDELLTLADDRRKDRASRISAEVTKFDFKKKIIHFKINGVSGEYSLELQVPDIKEISKSKKEDVVEKLRMAIEAGDVKIYCSCPDFTFFGFKYISNELDYSISGKKYKEDRPPKLRNPKEEGSVCKHCLHVLTKIDVYIPSIAQKYKESK